MSLPWETQIHHDWRARLLVRAYATLPASFSLGGTTCSTKEIGIEPDGHRQGLVDVRYQSDDLESAYFAAHDMAANLADRIAFLALSRADVRLISVTHPTSKIGALFDIAMPHTQHFRSATAIEPDDIAQFDKSTPDEQRRALRLFRSGVSAESPYHALTQLWAATEVLGSCRATQEGSYVENPCPECGHIQKGQPRAQPFIVEFFSEVLEQDGKASDADAVARATRTIRGKVVHGGTLQDQNLRNDVDERLGLLQASAASAISKSMGVRAAVRRTSRLGTSVMYAQIEANADMAPQDGALIVVHQGFGKWLIRAGGSLPAIPAACGRDQVQTIAIAALQFPFSVPNICWPEIVAE